MKKHIPNIITCCNLLCGCMATYVAFMSVSKPGPYYLIVAFCFIIGGAVFDFFDGDALERVVRGEEVGTLVS